MIKINTEYFSAPYYFLLSEKSDKLSLYYTVGSTLNEARLSEEKIDFDKKNMETVKKGVFNILKGKKLKSKEQVKKYFKPIEKVEGEVKELVDDDGSLSNSSIPIFDKGLSPIKTTDQTVPSTRDVINPVTRGYRKYYGESVVKEVDYSDAFGYEETKDMDGKQAYQYLVKKMGMSSDEAKERVRQFGKDPEGKKTKKAPEQIRKKEGFVDRMTLSEIERQKMIQFMDEILLSRKTKDNDVTKKSSDSEISTLNTKISKVLQKNIAAVKKMADKEGLTTNQLIKLIKSE